MADRLDPNSVALRRSPTVPQPAQIEPATGNLYAVVDGYLRHWSARGIPLNFAATNDDCFLTPLQTKPEPLRCWARRDQSWGIIMTAKEPLNSDWHPMIEAAELDRLRAAGDALAEAVEAFDGTDLDRLIHSLLAYREAVK